MVELTRRSSLLGAGLITAVALSACGGSSSRNVAVQVGAMAITKEMVNHYMNLPEASTRPVPPPALVPPHYTACIASLRAAHTKPAKTTAAATSAQLRSKCEQMYAEKKFEILDQLISADWVTGEAADLGVKVSAGEVANHFEALKNEQFPQGSEYKRFLAGTGYTEADLLARVRLMLLATRMRAARGAAARLRQPGYEQRWRAATNCRPGYIVADCRQYKGSSRLVNGTPE